MPQMGPLNWFFLFFFFFFMNMLMCIFLSYLNIYDFLIKFSLFNKKDLNLDSYKLEW